MVKKAGTAWKIPQDCRLAVPWFTHRSFHCIGFTGIAAALPVNA